MKSPVLWVDGAWFRGPAAALRLSRVEDLQAVALAESLPFKRGRPLYLLEHLDRLSEACHALAWKNPDRALISKVASALPGRNALGEGGLRLRWWGSLDRPVFLGQAVPLLALPAEGIRLATSAVRHYGPDSFNGRAKIAQMLPNWLARAETQAWADDGLRLTPQGLVAEGVWTNVVALKRGVARTPPLSEGVLDGVTRARLLDDLRKDGLDVREEPMTRFDLWTADKVWVTSSLRGCLTVLSVDGRSIGQGPVSTPRKGKRSDV